MEKQSVSRLSYLFSHLHLLSSDSFSFSLLSSNLSLLSASSLLCFSSVHFVGSLTPKLPSNRAMENHHFQWVNPCLQFSIANCLFTRGYGDIVGYMELPQWDFVPTYSGQIFLKTSLAGEMLVQCGH